MSRSSQLLTDNLQALFGNYSVWTVERNQDYPAGTLSGNPHLAEKRKLWFPTYEVSCLRAHHDSVLCLYITASTPGPHTCARADFPPIVAPHLSA